MQPLKNKTVLVTRSKEQAFSFIAILKSLGAKTIALPLIKNSAINQKELKTVFNSENYNWIIFTSPNAVNFFFKVINPKTIKCKIAVVGSKTEELLKKSGLTSNFIPSEFTAKKMAQELPVLENDKIFIPRSDLAKNNGVIILENRNCIVKTLSIYKNTAVKYSELELNKIFTSKIDFITFTSGSTVKSFIQLGIGLNNEKNICIGPETALIAEKHNLKVAAIANPHTIEGMIRSLIKMAAKEY